MAISHKYHVKYRSSPNKVTDESKNERMPINRENRGIVFI